MNNFNIKRLSIFPALERVSGQPLRKRDKIIVSIILVLFLFVFYVVLDANKYSAQVLVVEGSSKVGVNPTSESLDFGDLSRGSAMVRRVAIENGTFMPVYVMAFKTGSIASLIDIDKNFFRMSGNTEAKMEFYMYIPASAEIDKLYSGRVYLFKIPTFGL